MHKVLRLFTETLGNMDSEVSVMLHCGPSHGLEEHQVEVEISASFERRNVPEIEEHIEAVWKDRVTKAPWLFNGAKFRLHSAKLSTSFSHDHTDCCKTAGDGVPKTSNPETPHCAAQNLMTSHCDEEDMKASVAETSTASAKACREMNGCIADTTEEPLKDASKFTPKTVLTLQLGLTCYKDFLGTNWSEKAADLQRRGEMEFGDPQALLAQPLGVGAVMVTSDGQVVLLRRSHRVAEAAGLLDIPGGHPEPKALCPGLSEDAIRADLMQGYEKAVVEEIFSSVCAEIRDEVNVPLDVLGPPVLMGIALNHTSAGRPSAEFYIRCSLTTEEVKELYWRGGPEAHESTDIVFLSTEEMLKLDVSAPLWSELCPSAKGAVLLYKLVGPDHV